ncbi:MAG: hypothetical protein ACOYOU_20290 [Kiritimatiellia bacterium]
MKKTTGTGILANDRGLTESRDRQAGDATLAGLGATSLLSPRVARNALG